MNLFRLNKSNSTKLNERALLLVAFALIGFGPSPMARAQDPMPWLGIEDFNQLLVGHQWVMRSATLGNGVALVAIFNQDGSFQGMIAPPSGDFMVQNQSVNGTWYPAPPVLILQWDWVRGPGRAKMREHSEVPIEITTISSNRLQGIDKWWRLWQFERLK